MTDIKTAIMDAAERRIQLGGFGGFSFREIAADVGIKSSSVHYHFPTKEDLAAAVLRRWAEYTSELIDKELKKDPDPVRVWTKAFRGTAYSDAHMCPCTVLGVAPNLRTPFVSTWTLGIEQAFTNDLSLEVAYVGNRGSRLLGDRDVNQINIKTHLAPYSTKFPYLQSIDVLSNQDESKYKGLQIAPAELDAMIARLFPDGVREAAE